MIPMIKMHNGMGINSVFWVDEKDYDKHVRNSCINATLFYRQQEAKYAILRRELEKELVEHNVDRL